MMMGTKTPEGNLVLNTAGDYFSIAGEGFEFITGMSMGLGLVNVIISTLLLLALRKKNKDLSIAIT